ncbi:hypothetical protein ABZV34_27160 [Streptomyces sp. NPDC005195]|uniref:hypothetical protein n=1 Tax=Streptomyces sp. NPDC005195 TaxID=3154561 RepID=UPI0033B30A34
MTTVPIPAERRAALLAQLGSAQPASDDLVHDLAAKVRERAQHDHSACREDLHCLNLLWHMGDRMGPFLRRLLDVEADVERLTAEVSTLRRAATTGAAAAVRSVHQRGHEVHLPLELLEFLTGAAESAATEPGALARDGFQVVVSSSGAMHTVAEEVLCIACGGITTQAGFDGMGWTLARLDLLADRHRCLPRVPSASDAADPAPDEIQDCTCVEFCDEDPKTACSLSGRRHVHPASQEPGFGPCPIHPDAPGDI